MAQNEAPQTAGDDPFDCSLELFAEITAICDPDFTESDGRRCSAERRLMKIKRRAEFAITGMLLKQGQQEQK